MTDGGKGWVLGVDTSRKGIHLSLLKPDGSEEHLHHNAAARGESLTDELALLFTQQKISLSDIHSVVVTLGPGSFTGLRTGIAYCQGLCAIGDRELHGISSLAFFRSQFPHLQVSDTGFLLHARTGFWYALREKEEFLSDADVLIRIQDAQNVVSDSDRPLTGPLSNWNGNWIKLDKEWHFSFLLPKLAEFEHSKVLQANYLQPSYAER